MFWFTFRLQGETQEKLLVDDNTLGDGVKNRAKNDFYFAQNFAKFSRNSQKLANGIAQNHCKILSIHFVSDHDDSHSSVRNPFPLRVLIKTNY